MMKIDIRKFYPKEYQIGMHAIEWIKEQTGEDMGKMKLHLLQCISFQQN